MKRKLTLITSLVLLLLICVPIISTAEKETVQSYPTQIYVERTKIYPSYKEAREAPDEIFVQEWRYGVLYKGTIPIIDFEIETPTGKVTVIYGGYISYDPSVTPYFTQFIK